MGKKKRGMPKGYKWVAIIGKGPGRGLAPPIGTGPELWGCNNVVLQQPLDMAWDMHDLSWSMEENIENYYHLRDRLSEDEIIERAKLRDVGFRKIREKCRDENIKLMSCRTYPDIPTSIRFPLEKIIDKYDCDLFTSVVPYMIAYACYKRYNRIDLYGVNCVYAEEYAYQRESVSGWLMLAKGQGIKVTVNGQKQRPLQSEDCKLYGFNISQRSRAVEAEDRWYEAVDQQKAAEEGWNLQTHPDKFVERKFTVYKEA